VPAIPWIIADSVVSDGTASSLSLT
jgi:hypothetical protein